jgi:LPXTG-motif cell wall-anchored protein
MTDRDDDRSTASFLRGLTIGAIIGAILAGSSLWSRRRRRRSSSD